jgi:hypothetical protein
MMLVETMLASFLFVGCAAIAVAVGAAEAKLVDTFGSKLGLFAFPARDVHDTRSELGRPFR